MRQFLKRIAKNLNTTSARPAPRRRLCLEGLEDRAVPAVISPNGWHTATVSQSGPYFQVTCESKGPSTLSFAPIGGPVLEVSSDQTTNVVSQPHFSSDSTHLYFSIASGINGVKNYDVLLSNPTSISLSESAAASTYGQPVKYTATVTSLPGTPSPTGGPVNFYVDGKLYGTVALPGTNTASLTISNLSGGNHSITAGYLTDAFVIPVNYYPSQYLAPVLQVVSAAASSTSLGESLATSVYGQGVSFTATVKAVAAGIGVPGGTVSFYDGTTLVGTAGLNTSGQAVLTTASLPAGAHAISAQYNGSINFSASQSGPVGESVLQAGSATTFVSSAPLAVYGQMVAYTATVKANYPSAAVPNGSVTFYIDGQAQSPVALDGSGKAVFALSSMAVGGHTVTAAYGGGANFTGSQGGPLAQFVNKASTTTAVSASTGTSSYGQTVTFTAAVAAAAPGGGVPSGVVRFYLDTQVYTEMPLNGAGRAFLSLSNLSAGNHTVSAAYLGDNVSYLASSAPAAAGETVFLAMTAPTLPGVTAGDSYNATIAAKGGDGNYSYAVTSGKLPVGVTLSSGGVLSGVPTVAGTYTFEVKATSTTQANVSGKQTYSLKVVPAVTSLAIKVPATAKAGIGFYFTITSKDRFGNVVDGPVKLTSTDGQAVFPAGVAVVNGTLTTWAVLKTAGPKSITATLGSISGTSANVAVSPNALAKFAVTAPATATDGVAFPVTVAARDAFGNAVPSFSNTVLLYSSDGQLATPFKAVLVNGVGSASVTLNIAHKVTVNAVYGGAVGLSGQVVVNPAAVATVAVYYATGVGADTPLGVEVVAKDRFGNGIAAPVTLKSSDGQPITFETIRNNPGDMYFYAHPHKAGTIKLTATVGGVSGTGGNVIVYPTYVSSFLVAVPSTVKANTAFTISITAKDKYGNTVTVFGNVALALTSSDGQPVAINSGSWANGVATVKVTMKTPGTVSLTAAWTATIKGTSVPFTITA